MNEPSIQFIDDRHVRLLHDFHIDNPVKYIIHKGFVTDGASTPWFVWLLGWTPFEGKTLPCAVVHDYLCQTQAVPRWYADRIFLALLLENNVGVFKCAIYYVGVRLGATGRLIKNLLK